MDERRVRDVPRRDGQGRPDGLRAVLVEPSTVFVVFLGRTVRHVASPVRGKRLPPGQDQTLECDLLFGLRLFLDVAISVVILSVENNIIYYISFITM